jgi:disulfide bond formation protein DsbB
MQHRTLAALAGAISASLLAGAFYFQYVAGLAPCHLCITQRWAHGVAILAALAFIALPTFLTRLIGFLAAYCAAAAAFFHVGVELKWWPGPASCSGAAENLSTMSGAELLSMDGPVKIVQCTDVAWQFAGISMAGWNGLITLVVVAIWVHILHWRRG